MTTILKGYRVKPENSVAGCGTFSAFPDRSQKVAPLLAANGNIRNPRFENIRRLGSPIVESTPFVFKDKLYLLENFQECWNTAKPQFEEHDYLKDKVRIIDLGSGEIVAAPLIGYTFGIAFVWDHKVYVFAGNHHTAAEWRHVTELCMTCSDDLKNWTPPQTVLKALDGEHFFNFAVCRGKDSFVLLYETDDPQWPKFTFRYCVSDNLTDWNLLPGAIYGKDKYVGGPALYYEGDYYYTLYLEDLGNAWETRITRSQDLIHWEEAREPFITFDPSVKNLPFHPPEVCECNASDAEVCYWNGKTIIYFTGGIQNIAGDLHVAEFQGTTQELFEHYFADQ